MSSRDAILNKLRAARTPFTDIPPVTECLPMAPFDDISPAALRARFIAEIASLNVVVHEAVDNESAIAVIFNLIGDDKVITGWDFAGIALPGLAEALAAAGISRADPYDGTIRLGLTGVEAAIAATGSLVVASGAGRPRLASLLPHTHVALVRETQIVANLEAWLATRQMAGLDALRDHASIVLITGPSRTADIGQELILGAHGPVQVHVVLVAD